MQLRYNNYNTIIYLTLAEGLFRAKVSTQAAAEKRYVKMKITAAKKLD